MLFKAKCYEIIYIFIYKFIFEKEIAAFTRPEFSNLVNSSLVSFYINYIFPLATGPASAHHSELAVAN